MGSAETVSGQKTPGKRKTKGKEISGASGEGMKKAMTEREKEILSPVRGGATGGE